ncbi:Cytosine deaminase (EC 3.5.4.1) [Candidatus Synechococcus spongiarum]|uniref:Cytosine deaminase n=2 Tax=Candidatus Synechococcus spongiarum TaxID=431041 RepID=A0A164Z401_9SYNE|nr:Cytosine deaminase (EC 3.5.4.1) [Candidatus Synechococcus spongiarum]
MGVPPQSAHLLSPQPLQIRWPLALLDSRHRHGLEVDGDGLVNLALTIRGVTVTGIEPLPGTRGPHLPLALPAAVEPHCHLDKAFTWSQVPNPSGTMAAALAANLQEHKRRSAAAVAERMNRALETAWRHGYRALRSHLDLGGRAGSQATWEAMIHTWAAWSDRLQLQAVALAPLELWSTTVGVQLARRLARLGGGLGGALAHHNTRGSLWREHLAGMLRLAAEQGCMVDLHLDETCDPRSRCLEELLDLLEQEPLPVSVTVSHGCSLAQHTPEHLRRTVERLAVLHIPLISLPTTNLWLQDRSSSRHTPRLRGLAPIHELQDGGVTVAIGGDNVADPWFPGGNFDPVELWRFAVPVTHLHPWEQRGLTPFTSAPAQVLGLAWDGVLRNGCPADLILTEVSSWQAMLARPQRLRVLRNGCWLP